MKHKRSRRKMLIDLLQKIRKHPGIAKSSATTFSGINPGQTNEYIGHLEKRELISVSRGKGLHPICRTKITQKGMSLLRKWNDVNGIIEVEKLNV